ncbi:hypothetical protein EXIGLDRAFT_783825 [Exidia glandulosa HHB12029]|uniref:Uncharacterized protein n=1 Tax=Exidia glandulosa HHB12029 TaxID=1314781 RepID=A0A166MVB7_EXIGL|nr:hypothetical protein EXIGLDRAFT_783825 [Exidia glandulosa HHB12029]
MSSSGTSRADYFVQQYGKRLHIVPLSSSGRRDAARSSLSTVTYVSSVRLERSYVGRGVDLELLFSPPRLSPARGAYIVPTLRLSLGFFCSARGSMSVPYAKRRCVRAPLATDLGSHFYLYNTLDELMLWAETCVRIRLAADFSYNALDETYRRLVVCSRALEGTLSL